MEFDISWLNNTKIDTEMGLSYLRSEEKYAAALQRFYKNGPMNKEKIMDCYEHHDWEGYMILVHAVKSNAKMIGALSLSVELEQLEQAARTKDENFLRKESLNAMKLYDEVIAELSPIKEWNQIIPTGEIDGEEAKKTVASLLEALDEFDDDASLELVRKLLGYPFRMTQRKLVEDAQRLIEDFSYEEATELIKNVLPEIE